jgi:hypothetical protein
VDPQDQRHYNREPSKNRIQVADSTGLVLRHLDLKDQPAGLALDRKERLFVAYGNHYFIQVFSVPSCRFLGELTLENIPADRSYLNASYLSVTDNGMLVAADKYSVWVYQLPG